MERLTPSELAHKYPRWALETALEIIKESKQDEAGSYNPDKATE